MKRPNPSRMSRAALEDERARVAAVIYAACTKYDPIDLSERLQWALVLNDELMRRERKRNAIPKD